MNERRSVQRIAPEQPLRAKVHASFPVRVLDISERGAQIEVGRPLRPNVGCELRFPSPEGELVMRATVRRCRAWGFAMSQTDQRVLIFRAGLEFDRPDPELLWRLRLVAAADPIGGHGSLDVGGGHRQGADLAGEPKECADVPSEGDGAQAEGSPEASPARGPVKIRIRSDHIRRILES